MSALDIGNPDGEDEAQKAKRLAARAARFNKSAPGKRNKEVSRCIMSLEARILTGGTA